MALDLEERIRQDDPALADRILDDSTSDDTGKQTETTGSQTDSTAKQPVSTAVEPSGEDDANSWLTPELSDRAQMLGVSAEQAELYGSAELLESMLDHNSQMQLDLAQQQFVPVQEAQQPPQQLPATVPQTQQQQFPQQLPQQQQQADYQLQLSKEEYGDDPIAKELARVNQQLHERINQIQQHFEDSAVAQQQQQANAHAQQFDQLCNDCGDLRLGKGDINTMARGSLEASSRQMLYPVYQTLEESFVARGIPVTPTQIHAEARRLAFRNQPTPPVSNDNGSSSQRERDIQGRFLSEGKSTAATSSADDDSLENNPLVQAISERSGVAIK